MSSLRPTLRTCSPKEIHLGYKATYFRVLQAVSNRRGLIHGKLYQGAETCAIGAYFREASIPIDSKAIDEIAAYNDSFPTLCPQQRWRKVMAWLKFQTAALKAKP